MLKLQSSKDIDMDHEVSILVVEDNYADFKMIRYMIDEVPQKMIETVYNLQHANYLESALTYLSDNKYDIILLDLNLPDENGIDTLIRIVNKAPRVPIIVMTGMSSIEIAFEAIRKGAQDYLVKGEYNALTLVKSIHYAIERKTHQDIALQLDIQQEKNEWLKQLIDDVAHDFRTPLSVIRTSLYLYHKTEVPNYLETINNQVSYIENIIQDFIQVSKLENNVETIKYSQINLSEFVGNIVKDHQSLAEFGKKTLTFISENTNCSTIEGDKDLIYRAVINVLSNSFKYTKEDAKINVSIICGQNDVSISIQDDGIGIPNKDLPHVFERFYKVDKSRNGSGSTGLGLSITKKIIEIHKGKISIESREGQGTTCILTFPVSS